MDRRRHRGQRFRWFTVVGTAEVAANSVLAISLLCAPHVIRRGGHIRTGTAVDRLSALTPIGMNITLAVAPREKLGLAMGIMAAMTTLGPSLAIVVSGALLAVVPWTILLWIFGALRFLDRNHGLRHWHSIVRITQEIGELEGPVRKRVLALRVAHGWSLDEFARRATLSPSTLSRIENGQRRLALDQLVVLARALDTTLDQLVASDAEDVVVSRVVDGHGWRRWPVRAQPGLSVVRQRLTVPPDPDRMRADAGQEWLVVLSGTAVLLLGERRYRLEVDQAAEFLTMLPHSLGAERGPVDVLAILDRDARRDHQQAATGRPGAPG